MRLFAKVLATTAITLAPMLATAEDIVPEEGAELVIWTDESTAEFMGAATAAFNEDFGYSVTFTVTPVPALDAVTRLIQDGGTTRVADVMEIEHDTLGRAIVAGVVMENLVSAERVKAEFIAPAVNAASYGGAVYGFPVGFATVVLFYNKDILPAAPATFEELIAFAPGFNKPEENQFTLVWNVQNYYFSRMFLALFGAYEFGANGTDAADIGIASAEAEEGLKALLELKAANASRNADMVNAQVPRGLFAEGKIAALIEGPWATEALTQSGQNVGVVALPTFKGQHPRSFSTVRMAVVSTFTSYPRAAQLFADYLASDKMLRLRYEMAGSIPPTSALMAEIAPTAVPATQAVIAQAEYSDAMPSIPEMGFIWSPMAAALVDVWDNGAEPRAALDAAFEVITEQLALE